MQEEKAFAWKCVILNVMYFMSVSILDTSAAFNVSLSNRQNITCTYNGQQYTDGDFQPDSCTACRCDARTGSVTCSAQHCPAVENHCLRYTEAEPGQCCPRCMEYGCVYNGTVHPAGAVIVSTACSKCYCPWDAATGQNNAFCIDIKCQQPKCVDSIVPQGKCCPICPNGQNCYLDKRIIAQGERIYVGGCRDCFCSEDAKEYIAPNTPRHATCIRSFFCL